MTHQISKAVQLLYDYIHMKKLYAQLPQLENTQLKFVFNMVRINRVVFAYEIFLAAILSKYGADVYVIIDDGAMEHWDSIQYLESKKDFSDLNPCRNLTGRIFCLFLKALAKLAYGKNIKFIKTSKILKSFDAESINSDLDFNKTVKSSTRRFFQTTELDHQNPEIKNYMLLTKKNSQKSHLIGKYIVENIKPDKLITSHGIYSTWEPCFEYVRNFSDIECLVYGQHGYKVQEMVIAKEKLQIMDKASFSEDSSKKLQKNEQKKIEDYFKNRINLLTEDNKIYYNNVSNDVPLNTHGKVFAVFPRVVWDGDIEETHTLFSGQIEWLIDTIKYFEENQANTLVIRFHPSEITMGKHNAKLEDLIIKKYPSAAKIHNVILISSEQTINTYQFVQKQVDIGLVYDGTLGLEIPYMGKPVVFCGRGRFTGNGLGIEPKNKREYFDIFTNPEKHINSWDIQQKQKIALKIGYWYFFKMGFYLPTLAVGYEKDSAFYQNISFTKLQIDDISPQKNPMFRQTIEYLLK